jgi:hypothetical protein
MKSGRSKRSICVYLGGLLLAASLCFSVPLPGQNTASTPKKASAAKVSADKSKKSQGGGEDANIKNKSFRNDPSNADKVAPNKSGVKPLGTGPWACTVHVDSRVRLYINIFIDGNYAGTVGPGGDLYFVTGNGASVLYGRADFTDGSYYYWGPREFDCESTYTWRLLP